MLKLLGGSGGGGNGDGKARWQGKSFQIEKYSVTVEDTIAEGGFALVFLVKGGSGKKYALKRMAVNNEQDLFIARQEIAITKALSDSRHSVTYLASSILQTAPDVHEILILLELYTGGRVVDMMNTSLKTGLSEELVLKIFTDVCQAVARLHHRTKPIIHRDLKVENILRDSEGNFVLCDYGSCTIKVMHPEVLGAAHCEEQIARFTTMPYRAPEMVSLYSGNTITTKADIWALGCLLFKLCFFTTPFGEQALAIVSGTFSIPHNSKYSESLHSLIRYMLEPDIDKRPNIWQVAEVAFRIRRIKNPIRNVFRSQPPPSVLPTAPHAQKDKEKPTASSTTPPMKEESPSDSKSSGASRSRPRNTLQPQTPVSVIPRQRPRVHQAHRAPSPNMSASRFASHLHPPPATSAITTSLDSGLNRVAPAADSELKTRPPVSEKEQKNKQQYRQQRPHSSERHCKSVYVECDADIEESLDKFGQPYFTAKRSSSAERELAGVSARDEFGHPPFVPREPCETPLSHSSSSHVNAIDEFGSPCFISNPQPSKAKPHTSKDLFGAQPFLPSTDAFGSTPFVTS